MKISVCMATCNGEKYIGEQLDSILMQLGHADEVIISDDGSTDDTLNIIESLNDIRIKVFVNSRKLGVVSNFNSALTHASGDVIFLSDQDDIWLHNKVELCLKRIIDYDLIVTNCKVTDEHLSIVHASYFEYANSGPGFFKNIYKSTYLGCCLVFRRNLLGLILPIPPRLMLYHDWWIGFLAESKYSVHFEETPLLLYRRHFTTTTQTFAPSKNNLLLKIFFRLQLVFLAAKRLLRKV